MMLELTLNQIESGQDISVEQMAKAVGVIMEGKSTEDQVARLLVALQRKGETVDELVGAAQAMRQHMTPIRTERTDVLDVVGTGGDGSSTFNISTAAALVTAAAGVPVAKHGSIAASSRSGSADALRELGVNVEANVEVVEACLNEIGICFCFAPMLHPAMRHVAPIRQKLGTPTIFNILGPLANPANAQFQLLGVAKEELLGKMADALVQLGTSRAIVVYGTDGIDEVTLGGPTEAVEVVGGNQRRFQWHPEDFGLPKVKLDEIRIDNAKQSAVKIRSVLQNRPGPATDIVIANAAAAIWTAGRNSSIGQCTSMAKEAIESGAANNLLAQLVERTNAEQVSAG